MHHSNIGEVHQLLSTFNRVWGAGGEASLSLKTVDGKVSAVLEVQLGPLASPRGKKAKEGVRRDKKGRQGVIGGVSGKMDPPGQAPREAYLPPQSRSGPSFGREYIFISGVVGMNE